MTETRSRLRLVASQRVWPVSQSSVTAAQGAQEQQQWAQAWQQHPEWRPALAQLRQAVEAHRQALAPAYRPPEPLSALLPQPED